MIRVERVDAAVTVALRVAVLRPDAPPDAQPPGDAPDAIHLAAYDGDDVVGVAVLLPRPSPLAPDEAAWQLRGMAVAPDRQGDGVGSAVLAAAIEQTQHSPLWCNARSTARAFYERHGFVAVGDEFVVSEIGIEHFLMIRNPAVTPPRP